MTTLSPASRRATPVRRKSQAAAAEKLATPPISDAASISSASNALSSSTTLHSLRAEVALLRSSAKVAADEADQILDWIAAQPWCDGNIGMYGDSFQAMLQYAAASSGNPHLKAILPVSSSFDAYDAVSYSGGIYNRGFNDLFASSTAAVLSSISPYRRQIIRIRACNRFTFACRPVDKRRSRLARTAS